MKKRTFIIRVLFIAAYAFVFVKFVWEAVFPK